MRTKSPVEAIDYETLNPGIKDLVRELREVHCMDTTDSGDGETNVALGMEGALTERHVFILVELDDMIEATEYLAEQYPKAWVECSYSPGQSPNILLLPDGMVLPPGVGIREECEDG